MFGFAGGTISTITSSLFPKVHQNKLDKRFSKPVIEMAKGKTLRNALLLIWLELP